MRESARGIPLKRRRDTRFPIASPTLPAHATDPMIRAHRAAGNPLHRVMDMVLRDDDCRLRPKRARHVPGPETHGPHPCPQSTGQRSPPSRTKTRIVGQRLSGQPDRRINVFNRFPHHGNRLTRCRLAIDATDMDAALQNLDLIGARPGSAGVAPPMTLPGVTRLALPALMIEIAASAAD
jgi:hypothetical protein